MPQSLDVLESQRAELLRQIAQLGDLRSGSITSITARCGKPNCHCHQPEPSRPWPQLPPDPQGAGQDGERNLPQPGCPAPSGTSDCRVPQVSTTEPGLPGGERKDLSPASLAGGDGRGGAGKKTAQAIQREVAQEVESLLAVIFAGRRKSGGLDLEAVERATRAAMHRAGAAVLEELLAAPDEYPRQVPCGCGGSAQYHENRPKQLLTVLGRVKSCMSR